MRNIRIILSLIIFLQLGIYKANAQITTTSSLITQITWDSLDVPSGKDSLLYYILNNPIYDTVFPVKVGHLLGLQEDGLLSFKLPTINDTIRARDNLAITYSDHNFTWHGELTNMDGDMMIVEDSGNVFGYFFIDSSIFELVDLGHHSNILIKYEEDFLTEEKCAVAGGLDDDFGTNTTNMQPRGCPADVTDIRILVLYSPDAGRKVDVIQKTKLFFEQLNTAFINSEVEMNAIPVGPLPLVTFDETENISADLDALRLNEYANGMRIATGSDMVVLYVDGNYDDNQNLGYAYIADLNSEVGYPDWAFALVEADGCIKYTFPHEIAHVFGCRHDDSPSSVRPYARGYYWTHDHKRRLTILCKVGSSHGQRRILNYSNPEVDFDGHVTGHVEFRNNARELREAKSLIADNGCWAPDMAVSMSGPTHGYNYTQYHWCPIVTNCNNITNYLWEFSTDAYTFFTGYNGPNADCFYSYLPANKHLYLRLTVTCSTGKKGYAHRKVTNDEWLPGVQGPKDTLIIESGILLAGDEILEDINIYPNPSNSENINVTFNLKRDADVQIIKLDPFGTTKNVYLGHLLAGENTVSDQSRYKYTGIYYYTILAENEIHTLKMISTPNGD